MLGLTGVYFFVLPSELAAVNRGDVLTLFGSIAFAIGLVPGQNEGLETWGVTEHQRLFLVQARTDFAVFGLLRGRPNLPACHALHYLQMATELLGKAHAWKHDPAANTHRAFVGFLRSLSTNRKAQKQLGFGGQNERWKHLIRKSVPLSERIEDLAPALALDAPNPEYPWPRAAPQIAPAEHNFEIWQDLQDTAAGRQFISTLGRLFEAAEAFLRRIASSLR
jgi:hypothetical protein